MIKNQFLTTEETRNITGLRNFELIDYCGRGLTPLLRTSKKPYRICSGEPRYLADGTRISDGAGIRRLADGKLTLVTHRKLESRKRILDYPSMKNFYYLNGVEPPKVFEFNPDQHECIPDWEILLPHMEEHVLFKREEVNIFKQKMGSVWYQRKEKVKKLLKNQALVKKIKEVKPDLMFLYNSLKEAPGFGNYDAREEKLIEEAITLIREIDNPYLKEEYVEDPKIYSTNPDQTPRDFIGPLLQKIVKNELDDEIDYQLLYDVFLNI